MKIELDKNLADAIAELAELSGVEDPQRMAVAVLNAHVAATLEKAREEKARREALKGLVPVRTLRATIGPGRDPEGRPGDRWPNGAIVYLAPDLARKLAASGTVKVLSPAELEGEAEERERRPVPLAEVVKALTVKAIEHGLATGDDPHARTLRRAAESLIETFEPERAAARQKAQEAETVEELISAWSGGEAG